MWASAPLPTLGLRCFQTCFPSGTGDSSVLAPARNHGFSSPVRLGTHKCFVEYKLLYGLLSEKPRPGDKYSCDRLSNIFNTVPPEPPAAP